MGRPKGSKNKITPETIPSEKEITPETVPTVMAKSIDAEGNSSKVLVIPLWDCFPENKPFEREATPQELAEIKAMTDASARMRQQGLPENREVITQPPGATQQVILINPVEFKIDDQPHQAVPAFIEKNREGWQET